MPRKHARQYGRRSGGSRQSPQGNTDKHKSESGSDVAQATATGGSTNTESCPAPTTVTVTSGAAATTTDATTTSTTAAAGNTGNQNKFKNNNKASSTSTTASTSTAAAGKGNQDKHRNKNTDTASSTSASASTSDSASASASDSTSTSDTASTTASATSSAASVSSTDASNNNSSDPQTSLTLLSTLVETGLKNDGQSPPVAGQVASLTSNNNFINFCAGKVITNGQQITTGSCNPIPMGDIIPKANMPSCKFVSPKNQDVIPANQSFVVTMNINNMQAGVFTNAQKTYYMAPQQLNGQGILIGHSHFVIQAMGAFTDPTILDPATFAFFKGIDNAAVNGQLTANVTAGLSPGNYRLASINTDSNHAPALPAVAQHGWLDDIVYFTVQ